MKPRKPSRGFALAPLNAPSSSWWIGLDRDEFYRRVQQEEEIRLRNSYFGQPLNHHTTSRTSGRPRELRRAL